MCVCVCVCECVCVCVHLTNEDVHEQSVIETRQTYT